uniref:Uncharacterized protein n=1 Tax=Oryza sativa subsp. japonica TaxID=39947 RepID=Q6AVJ0_ORYSJ|nr:hypothetical protein [Oryza sativa Japonica Group]
MAYSPPPHLAATATPLRRRAPLSRPLPSGHPLSLRLQSHAGRSHTPFSLLFPGNGARVGGTRAAHGRQTRSEQATRGLAVGGARATRGQRTATASPTTDKQATHASLFLRQSSPGDCGSPVGLRGPVGAGAEG